MARRSFAIPLTALIAGAIGFAAGVYLAPTDEANEFRNLLRSSIDANTETSTPVSPPSEAPQAKDSEAAKRPPEAAEPISPTDSRNNPPAEMVGAEPKPTTTSTPTAPVTPGPLAPSSQRTGRSRPRRNRLHARRRRRSEPSWFRQVRRSPKARAPPGATRRRASRRRSPPAGLSPSRHQES